MSGSAAEFERSVVEGPPQCTKCDYVLEGLPAGTICPACGTPSAPRQVVLHDQRKDRIRSGAASAIVLGYVVMHFAYPPRGHPLVVIFAWALWTGMIWMPALYIVAMLGGLLDRWLQQRVQILPAGRIFVWGSRRTFLRWRIGSLIHVWRDSRGRLWVSTVWDTEVADAMLGAASEATEARLVEAIERVLDIHPKDGYRPRVTRTKPYNRRRGWKVEHERASAGARDPGFVACTTGADGVKQMPEHDHGLH